MRSFGVRLLLLPLLLFIGVLVSSPPKMELHDPLGIHQVSVDVSSVELAATFTDATVFSDVPSFDVERTLPHGDSGGAFLMASSSLMLLSVRRRKRGRLHRESKSLNRLTRLMIALRSSFGVHGSLLRT